MASVEGWLERTDAELFCLFDAMQREQTLTGDLLEVGVFAGKTAILLGILRTGDERLVLCDLFEHQPITGEVAAEHVRHYQGIAQSTFEANYQRFHEEAPDVLVGSSTEVLAALPDDSFRFIHIDGSHAYDVVVEDIRTTRRLLTPGGIVVFDDVFARNTPGVGSAVWDAVLHHDLIPLASTGKLYATWSAGGDHLRDALEARLESDPGLRLVDRHGVGQQVVLEVGRRYAAPTRASKARRLVRDFMPPAATGAYRRLRARA